MDKIAYCPIDGTELWALVDRKRKHDLYCIKCKRGFTNHEALWRTRPPKVTKKMLRYQAALARGKA